MPCAASTTSSAPSQACERARDLVREVDVAGRVDQVELVALPGDADRLGLDRDAPFPLELHRVEHLLAHLARRDRLGELEDAVGERRLAVVDVRDDREVADAALVHPAGDGTGDPLSSRACGLRFAAWDRTGCGWQSSSTSGSADIDPALHLVHNFAQVWREEGLEVVYLYGTERFVPADLGWSTSTCRRARGVSRVRRAATAEPVPAGRRLRRGFVTSLPAGQERARRSRSIVFSSRTPSSRHMPKNAA